MPLLQYLSGVSTMRKAVALYTGGKDSHYAIVKALEKGIVTTCLIIVRAGREDSWMFHTVNIDRAILHAKLMDIPYVTVQVSGAKEIEVEELKHALGTQAVICTDEVEYLVTGAVASRYQKERVDVLAEELGLKHYAPLWGADQDKLFLEEASTLGFLITAVQAYGLSSELLGRLITHSFAVKLLSKFRRYSISPVGEGGEFETFVISSPLFKGRSIAIRKASMMWNPNTFTGYYVIEDVGVIP